MKKPRNPEEIQAVQEKILAAALTVIDEEGFPSLTMRKIAKKSGMTAPNIYNYFGSKDAIYITLVYRGFTQLKAALQVALEKENPPMARARTMAMAYLRFGLLNPALYEIMFTSRTPRHQDYVGTELEALSEKEYRVSMEIAEMAANAANDAIAGRLPQGVTPDEAVVAAWSLLHGMVSLNASRVMEYVVEDPESAYGALVNALFTGIAHS